MIEVRELGHRFGLMKVALDDVSFDVPEGSVCAVLGRNGSGKTTLLRVLAGLFPTDQEVYVGRAFVCGLDPATDPLEVRKISAFLPASGPLRFRHRVQDLARLHDEVYPDVSAERVLRRIAEQGIDASTRVQDLSRGELRRVLTTLVLDRDPEVLLLDEPTDGLDPEAAEYLLDQIRRRAARANRCTLIATHRPEEVERVCDRVLLLRSGRVLLSGDLDDLKDSWSRLLVRTPPTGSDNGEPDRVGIGRIDDWEGVVSIDRDRDEWVVTVSGDASLVAARMEEYGASEIEIAPIAFRELYLSAMGSIAGEEVR